MAPVAKMTASVIPMPAAMEPLTKPKCGRLQPIRRVALIAATANITSSATATQSGLVMTPPRTRLIAASCALLSRSADVRALSLLRHRPPQPL